MDLVEYQVEGCPYLLHHLCQGDYETLNDINFDGAAMNIYCNCVDELREWGKSDILNKVEGSTVYRMDES